MASGLPRSFQSLAMTLIILVLDNKKSPRSLALWGPDISSAAVPPKFRNNYSALSNCCEAWPCGGDLSPERLVDVPIASICDYMLFAERVKCSKRKKITAFSDLRI
jgi:hypothetical protein